MGEEDAILAGELALGVLDGGEKAAALRRLLADPLFAVEVERWRRRLDGLYAAVAPAEPPAALEARVLAAIGRSPATRLAWWRAGAVAASLVAVLLLALLLVRPERPVAVPPPRHANPAAPPLIAALASDHAAPVSVLYDPASGRIALAGDREWPRDRSPELWVIASGAGPRPIGLLAGRGVTHLVVPAATRRVLAPGATLAISIEPPGGSPTRGPTGPVVASGLLAST